MGYVSLVASQRSITLYNIDMPFVDSPSWLANKRECAHMQVLKDVLAAELGVEPGSGQPRSTRS